MERTETELREAEVKRVYCDECGDECTDSHNHVRRQLCEGCTDWSVVEEASAKMPRVVPHAKQTRGNIGIGPAVGGALIWPFVFLITTTGSIRRDHEISRHDMRILCMHVIGAVCWTTLVSLVVVALVL